MGMGIQVRVQSSVVQRFASVIEVVDLVWASAAVATGAAVLAAGVERARTGGFAGGDRG